MCIHQVGLGSGDEMDGSFRWELRGGWGPQGLGVVLRPEDLLLACCRREIALICIMIGRGTSSSSLLFSRHQAFSCHRPRPAGFLKHLSPHTSTPSLSYHPRSSIF